MYNILLCITYDGTHFHGFQRQAQKRSIQQEIEQALTSLLNRDIEVIPSGRTDSGVHAERQYLHFKIAIKTIRIPPERISFALNAILPKDIKVYWSRNMNEDFHARYSAVKRGYYYQFYEGKVLPPYLRYTCLRVPKGIDWSFVQKDLQQFLGTHNFSSFSSYNPQIRNYVRTVYRAELLSLSTEITRIYMEANGFLWKMVRSIVGTCIERAKRQAIGCNKKRDSCANQLSISEILRLKDRSKAGTVAAPWGLFLYDVQYKQEYGIECKLS